MAQERVANARDRGQRRDETLATEKMRGRRRAGRISGRCGVADVLFGVCEGVGDGDGDGDSGWWMAVSDGANDAARRDETRRDVCDVGGEITAGKERER